MTTIVIIFLVIMLLIFVFVLSVSKISRYKLKKSSDNNCNQNVKTTQSAQNKSQLTLQKLIMADFHNAGCDIWDESIHKAPGQFERMQRGFEQPITILSFNDKTGTAEIEGASGEHYTTSLFGCSCPDFTFRQLPCKHMYHLAMELEFNDSIPHSYTQR